MRFTTLWIDTMNTTDHPRIYPKFTFPICCAGASGVGCPSKGAFG